MLGTATDAIGTAIDAIDIVVRYALMAAAYVVGATLWTILLAIPAYQNYLQGDLGTALLGGVMFVIPVVGLLAWTGVRVSEDGLPVPSVGTDA